MEIHCIPADQVRYFASKDVAYATQHPALRPFYNYNPTLESFQDVIHDKQSEVIDRELLVNTLSNQYATLSKCPAVEAQLSKLQHPNTFTVTTAHQPALFTGPLYYVYKILGTIHLARKLNETYPAFHFVPVFVSGAEDHDFDEINHANLFGKTLRWELDAQGPSGLLPASTLQPILDQLQEVLGDTAFSNTIMEEIRAAYTSHSTYGMAAVDLVHRLFGSFGLVVLDMNHVDLKRRFVPIMREELFSQTSQALVEQTQQALTDAGFSGQAHAREINLFYLGANSRQRIVRNGNMFEVLGTSLQFSPEQMQVELEQHPERFSPNVVLRPLYQEMILPNLAYIGGGGEIAYWLERKSQFEHFGINFPMLIRRNSVLWIDRNSSQRMDKLGIDLHQLFLEPEALVRSYIAAKSEDELSLSQEMEGIKTLFAEILRKAVQVDPTLEKTVLAEESKQLKVLEHLETRLLRAEKNKHDTELQQLRNLKEKLFPGQGLQERYDNFLPLYAKYGPFFFERLLEELDPLKPGMLVFLDRG